MRPRDAATLILVRRDRGAPELLMGRRAGGHAFMPGKWVFPGGRLDRCDWHAPVGADLPPEVAAAVGERPARPRRSPERLARALALAAVRETFEETGLILGRPGDPVRAPGGWERFCGSGYRADLSGLAYVARAITPPGRPRRFDARFFLCDASHLAHQEPQDSRELAELAWFPLDDARTLDLPSVTRAVLDLVEQHCSGRPVTPPFWAIRSRMAAD
ncbi:MAG: NUDIX hydrolase [Sphingomonadaceae bacterium]